jgi:hypothetical protein
MQCKSRTEISTSQNHDRLFYFTFLSNNQKHQHYSTTPFTTFQGDCSFILTIFSSTFDLLLLEQSVFPKFYIEREL